MMNLLKRLLMKKTTTPKSLCRHVAVLDTAMPSTLEMAKSYPSLSKFYSRIGINRKCFLKGGKTDLGMNEHGSLAIFHFTRPLWNITIEACECLDGHGVGSAETFLPALRWCIDRGVDAVITSSGFFNLRKSAMRELKKYSKILRSQGTLLAASAGNTQGGKVLYPACLPEWVAVNANEAWAANGPEVLFVTDGSAREAYGINGHRTWDGTSASMPALMGVAYRMILEFDKLPFVVHDRQETIIAILCFLAHREQRRSSEILVRDSKIGFGDLYWLEQLMLTQFDKWREDNDPIG